MHTHTVIIYLPSTLLFLYFLLHPYPFPASIVFLFYPLCHIPFFFSLFPSPLCIILCLHVSSVTPPWMCMNVQSVWEGHGQFSCRPIPKSPLLPGCLSWVWEVHQYHQQAQQFMQEWCDFLLQSQLLWKQNVVNQSVGSLMICHRVFFWLPTFLFNF